MTLYLDTSALVPLHIAERTSEAVERCIGGTPETVLVSDFAAAEFAAALAGRVRQKLLTLQQLERILDAFDHETLAIASNVEITSLDIRRAGQLARRITPNIRVPDAIHVAACIRLDATLITSDHDQADAARFHGVDVIEPA